MCIIIYLSACVRKEFVEMCLVVGGVWGRLKISEREGYKIKAVKK